VSKNQRNSRVPDAINVTKKETDEENKNGNQEAQS
jgi:hypothetical protein